MLGTVLVASLIGSLHCAAMCGGLVAFAAGSRSGQGAFHLGRWLGYASLGAIAGSAGAVVDGLVGRAGLPALAAIVSGALMISWGVLTLLAQAGRLPSLELVPASIRTRAFALHVRALAAPPALRGLALGVSAAVIPCGWLYVFVAAATSSGSALAGAASMSAFWLGTVPILLGVGALGSRVLGPLRHHLPRIGAVTVIVLGLLSLWMRAPLSIDPTPRAEVSCHGSR